MKKFKDFKVHSYAIRAEIFQVHKHTKIQFMEKIKWNSKIYLLIIESKLHYNPHINGEVLGLPCSLPRYQS